MKKTLLSVVLCVAVLLSTMSAMLVMPASAASTDLLTAPMAPNDGHNTAFEYANGVLSITATAEGDEVGITPETPLSIAGTPFVTLTIESEVAFDIAFFDKDNNKWMLAAGDFCYNFGEGLSASNPIPAGKYTDVRIDLSGAYTWTGDPVPANADLDFVSFVAKAPGKITVSKLEQGDGMVTNSYTSPNYTNGVEWVKYGMLNSDPTAWGSVDATSTDANTGAETVSSAVIAADGTGISVSSTNGLWPAATYDYATPFEVDFETSALEVSFSIWSGKQSKVLLFYGDSTNANWETNEYVELCPLTMSGDLSSGHYVLNLQLKDILPDEANVNGKVKLNGIKVFSIGADKCVTVNALNLLVAPEKNEGVGGEGDLGVNDTTPPSNAPVTPNTNNNNNTGNTNKNPGTGDNTNAVLFVIVAAAAAGVVTLSVVSKKAKAN